MAGLHGESCVKGGGRLNESNGASKVGSRMGEIDKRSERGWTNRRGSEGVFISRI